MHLLKNTKRYLQMCVSRCPMQCSTSTVFFLFPAQKEEEEPVYAKIPDYNNALKAMCDEEGITFIDNTEIVKDEYYEQDGEHMKAEYYPIWAEHMAEVAGI